MWNEIRFPAPRYAEGSMRSINRGLHFDPYQFYGRPTRPISCTWRRDADGILVPVSTGIGFDDYNRMGPQQRHVAATLHFVPEFTQNDKQLRLVLAQYAWAYLGNGRTRVPDSIVESWHELKRFVDARTARGNVLTKNCPAGQRRQYETYRKSSQGKWFERLAGVAYRTWRLRQDSVAIAEALGITPVTVRQIRWRILRAAAQLGFDIGPLGALREGRQPAPLKLVSEKQLAKVRIRGLCAQRKQKVAVAVALEMRAEGKSFQEIAKVFRTTRTAVWLALKKHKEQENAESNN